MKYKTTKNIKDVTYDLQFHRGGRDVRPENTLYSYLYSIEYGATTIECDMQLCKDNIVLSHEPFINSTYAKDKKGNYIKKNLDIRKMYVKDIQQYNYAKLNPNTKYYQEHGKLQKTPEFACIPTIDELFTLVKKYGRGIHINMETKLYHGKNNINAKANVDYKKFVNLFNEKVKQYKLEKQVTLQSFDWNSLIYMKKINPKIETIALFSKSYLGLYEKNKSPYLAGININDKKFKGDPVEAAHYLKIDSVSPIYKEVTINMVNKAHKYNMKIIPWTINNINELEALYNMGVDGIITDKPLLVRDYLLNKGETLLTKKIIKSSPYHIK